MAQTRENLPSENLIHSSAHVEPGLAAKPLEDDPELVIRPTKVSSPGRDAVRRFRRNWAAVVSLAIILICVLAAIFAPFLHTANPLIPDYNLVDAPPNAHHWFGADGVGRDIYTRILFGMRVPLIVGVLGTVITVLLGALLGLLAGYFGGIIDSLLSRFTDLIFAFPAFLLALLCVSLFGQAFDAYFGGAGRVIVLTMIFAVVGWPGLMRFIRSLVLQLKEQQFVEAARTSGSSTRTILTRHLLPNMWGLILIQGSFVVVSFIYLEAVLSLFGLGVSPPNPDLGRMLFEGTEKLTTAPWETIVPATVLTMLILCFTFLGDGIRDAVDPRMNN